MADAAPYLRWMRYVVLLMLALPAVALGATKTHARLAHHAAGGPKSIGKFYDWQAATHIEGGRTVCYAFTRASSSTPPVAGRGDVVLTVTERATGRDAVAISAGLAISAAVPVGFAADKTRLDFYSAGRSAFARDGHAAVAAFARASNATSTLAGPKGSVTDTFSLHGFAAGLAAIDKACPAK